MKRKHYINRTNPLMMLFLMSCVITENYVDNPQLRIIIGDRIIDRGKNQIIK